MMRSIKKYWRIFWHFRRLHLMRQLEYRGDFFFWAFVGSMWTILHFVFVGLIVNVAGDIGGWNQNELFLLLAVATLLESFLWSFFHENMVDYTKAVFSGDLNQHLVRPIDTQFLLMVQRNSYSDVFRFTIGCFMLIRSLVLLNYVPDWPHIVLFLALFICLMTFIYSLWFCISTISFWVDKLDNINEVIPAMQQIYQLPSSVYQGAASFLLIGVLPIGIATTVPATALLGKPIWSYTIYLIAFTIGLLLFSRWFFKISIKRYSGMAN